MNSFILPYELTDLNTYINAERRNKFIAAKIKETETSKIALFCKDLQLENKQYDVIIDWWTKDKRKDSDNIFFSAKFIFDGLIKAGKLQGDGYKNVRNIHNNRFIGHGEVIISFIEV